MDTIRAKWKEILALIIVTAVVIGAVWLFFHLQQQAQQELQQPQEISQEQTKSVRELQERLKASEENSRELAERIKQIQSAQNRSETPRTQSQATSPAVAFTVPAVSAQEAADSVKTRIEAGDTTLPEKATEKADRTVVTPITTDTETGAELPEQEQRVDVYKIDLRRDHRIKTGIAATGGQAYGAVGYEQGRMEGIILFGAHRAGGAMLYNIAEW